MIWTRQWGASDGPSKIMEQILIYGDYDADGMTSASIMKETLEQMGAEVQVYLPNRFTDGYGPNESVYKYFIEQQGIS